MRTVRTASWAAARRAEDDRPVGRARDPERGGVTEEDRDEMRRRFAEEELLQVGGFEPAPDDGAELWVRREDGLLRLYTRMEALQAARRGTA